MYYWLQNDVRPPDGRAFDWNGRLRRFTPRFSGTVYPSALTLAADQTRWAGSGTRRDGRPASQDIFGRDACCEALANLCGLEYDAGHDHIASKLSTVIKNTNTATFR